MAKYTFLQRLKTNDKSHNRTERDSPSQAFGISQCQNFRTMRTMRKQFPVTQLTSGEVVDFRETRFHPKKMAAKVEQCERVSMGLTVSRKTAKNLAVRRRNERILTVSRKKMLTVKKSNHKIRYRDLLLSLMCYAFTCSGSENYNRNRKCRKCLHNLSHGCRCAS